MVTETKSSKAILPLVEITIALIIFIIAAIITLQLFFLARFMGDKTKDRARAMLEIQNIAEEIKAQNSADGIEAIINSLQTGESENIKNIYFSGEWIAGGSDFEMSVKIDRKNIADGFVYTFDINIYKIEPYPFVDEKYKEMDYKERPFSETVRVVKFVTK